MKFNGIDFEAVMATPGCGKSYLCDKYPNKFVDLDEVRVRVKYFVPENISREEYERTKGDRPYERRKHGQELVRELYALIDQKRANGKILIASPHPEFYDYFKMHNIKFCLVYADASMKEELKRRYLARGNSDEMANEQYRQFEQFYEGNVKDDRPDCKYAFGEEEFLEDIVKKFGIEFDDEKSYQK